MKTQLALLLLLIASPVTGFTQGKIVSPGEVSLSPDKTKSVKLLDYDHEFHYEITDEKTGDVTILDARYNPVFAIVWSADSQSIFVVAHVARGVLAQILHLNDDRWNIYTIDVPDPRDHEYTLLSWSIKPTVITLVCKVGIDRDVGGECYLGTFDVDPSTGKTSNLKKKNLTDSECLTMKSNFVRE